MAGFRNIPFFGTGETPGFSKRKTVPERSTVRRLLTSWRGTLKNCGYNRFNFDPSHSSGPCHATNFCGIPYPESAYDGKKNDDNDGEGGLTVGCTTILRYIASPSRRARRTTIIVKLCFFVSCYLQITIYTLIKGRDTPYFQLFWSVVYFGEQRISPESQGTEDSFYCIPPTQRPKRGVPPPAQATWVGGWPPAQSGQKGGGTPAMILRGGTTPPVWQASGNRGVRRNVHEIPCEARVMVLEIRGGSPPSCAQRRGWGCGPEKKRRPPSPLRFFGSRGSPLVRHASGNRGVRRNVHEIPCEARVMVLEIRGGSPPSCAKRRGWGCGPEKKRRPPPLS